MRGIDGAGSRGDITGATVAQVAAELGKSERTVKTMRTLADLIEPLSAGDFFSASSGLAFLLPQEISKREEATSKR